MASAESMLVLVQPGDTVEKIAAEARGAGSSTVELLVPEDNAALQSQKNMSALREQLERDGVSLLVISSDARVLRAAQASGVGTLHLQGVNVAGPLLPSPSKRRPPAPPQAARDSAFLRSLDAAATGRYAGVSSEDADLYAAFDDLSDAIQSSAPVGRRAPDAPSRERTSYETRPIEAEAPRRVRPEDITIDEDDMRRQRGTRRPGSRRESQRAAPAASRALAPTRRGARARDLEEEPAARRWAVSPLLLLLLLLIAVAVALVVWALSSRVTVTVMPPSGAARELPFEDAIIPYENSAASPVTAAIQAAPVAAEATFTAEGRVANQTMSPAGRAAGVIQITNTIGQAINLPEGTEFSATNPQGAEVRFALDAPVTVPPAVTTQSDVRTVTEYGRIDVTVTARSPGSASNVDANSIRQILIPGQQPINVEGGNPIIRHAPLVGGSEEPQFIVTEADVERVLGEALTGLYNAGVQQLRAQTDEVSSTIDPTTINPSTEALARPESYEPPLVEPPVGQPADPANPVFRVTVRTRFNALAVRPDSPIEKQLQQVAPNYFAQRSDPPCTEVETQQTAVDSWVWDGASLKISGMVVCTPRGDMAPETRLRVREAVRGKSRDEAEVGLRALQEQGLIGGYVLPDVDQLPAFDALLDVEFASAPGSDQ